jgi:hypothetical protein
MLIEITTSIMLAVGAKRCGDGETVFSITTDKSRCIAVCGLPEAGPLYSQSVEDALAEDLAFVPEVNHIFVERVEKNLLVLIAANNPSTEARERIFQKQFELIDAFPEISFDFNVISTNSATSSEITSLAKLVYSR